MTIAPHGGGSLVDLRCSEAERPALLERARGLRSLALDSREQTDLELLAIGGFSPLRGFMGTDECKSVVNDMHLPGGVPWTIPVVLSADGAFADSLAEGEEIALVDSEGVPRAILEVRERFRVDRRAEATRVYGTDEEAHPGVSALYAARDVRLSGPLTVLSLPPGPFPEDRLEPAQTRAEFERREWSTVVAFQTRNPIHRAHEYLTKVALEITDGLLIHPLVGETKSDDIPADVRMRCYKALIDGYYPGERVVLSVLPASMRYAGPREAVFHAIMRRNYGCTHFIVGRDHAGVGDYYGTYDAQRIFDEFDPAAIGIVPLKFEHAFFCRKMNGMASNKTTNSAPDQRVFLSGTRVREMLQAGEDLPPEFTRPEVSAILVEAFREARAGR
ncbi:MAG: sulfate adenylyltransferase [Myxococcota bacterium]